jgi:hypothetical protein
LKQHEFARPEWVYGGQRHGCHESTEEASPHCLDAESVAHFLEGSNFINQEKPTDERTAKCTSMEKRTPPMGEPNATATPAALAAVTISRILPG